MDIEEKLKQEIEKFLGHSCNWKNSSSKELEKLNLSCRKNLSEFDGQSYKYVECTKFNQGTKICVGIGFNPAEQSPDKIDDTNQKIIEYLNKEKYKKYILLNLYPLVSKSKETFDESDENSVAFAQKCLPSLLETVYKDTDADVLILWGREVEFECELYDQLCLLCKEERLYITVNQGDNKKPHWHPSRVSMGIEKAKSNRFMFKII